MPLNINFQQILLHMFNFVLLFGILYFLLYKPVKDFMDKRQKEYEKVDAETAQRLKDAEAKEAEYTALLEKAEDEITAMKKDAHKDIEEESARRIKEAESEAAEVLAKARKEANAEKERIVLSSNKEITGLVTAATRRMVFKDTEEAYEKFLDTLDKNKQ